MLTKMEDKSICKQCGGYCCKKCGCDYFVSDFEKITIDCIEELLDTGRVSIVSTLGFDKNNNGKLMINYILYLRARNVDRDEIDLLTMKTRCASLTDEGCYYDLENRPSGGAALIPRINNGKLNCYTEIDRRVEVIRWMPYQKMLYRVIKRRTGMSVAEKLKSDSEELFYNYLIKNFDGILPEEIYDITELIPHLKQIYPEQFENAKDRAKKVKTINLIK